MSRKPLVDNERIIAEAEALAAHFEQEPRPPWGYMSRMIERELKNLRNEYEAALDGARSWCKTAEENDELRKRLDKAIHIIQVREDMCEGANEAIAMYKKRIADLEAQNAEPEPTPGFFNAENMDYLNKMMHTNRLAIGWLSDRVAQLERAQREGQGEL